MSRIDAVTLKIYATDEFEGGRYIEFPVPLAGDDAFVAVIQQKWQEYSDRLLAQARQVGAGDILVG